MMRKRVVVTGLGCVSPLGNNVDSTWSGILTGQSGVGYITHFDASEFETRIAAEVKGFEPEKVFGYRETRRMDRFTQLALAATLQALENSGLVIGADNHDRCGVIIGTGIGGIGTIYEQIQVFSSKGPKRVSPFLVPMMIPDAAGGMIAIHLGIRGPNMAVITACATGTNAVGEAAEIIRRGQADVIFAGGSEAAIVPIAMAGMNVMNALSTRNDDPQAASRPFDQKRDGFVMGEGAAVLVLEAFDHARKRGAKILAEVTGYATTNDAYHISAPAENGEGAASCMQLALENAGLKTDEISYINAHGTSTLLNDKSETAAIRKVFGEQAYDVPISSTKSMTGHLLGASGALEAVFSVKALQDAMIPPTINYETPDPECDLDYVPNSARQSELRHVMSNSFGFGGHNATIILSRYDDNVSGNIRGGDGRKE
ncbi:MAG: beta-ketoacyl-[acyl-carrier-protein] synthase II [Chloroflexi bacterium RBG_16_54_18]|nr:MAG: beta-ketoacyl-[acyl-carrier-protein] synthase II [Chloroflexi bacterium RBG_16_54_18]